MTTDEALALTPGASITEVHGPGVGTVSEVRKPAGFTVKWTSPPERREGVSMFSYDDDGILRQLNSAPAFVTEQADVWYQAAFNWGAVDANPIQSPTNFQICMVNKSGGTWNVRWTSLKVGDHIKLYDATKATLYQDWTLTGPCVPAGDHWDTPVTGSLFLRPPPEPTPTVAILEFH